MRYEGTLNSELPMRRRRKAEADSSLPLQLDAGRFPLFRLGRCCFNSKSMHPKEGARTERAHEVLAMGKRRYLFFFVLLRERERSRCVFVEVHCLPPPFLEKSRSSRSISPRLENFGESPFYRFVAANCIPRYISSYKHASRFLPGQNRGERMAGVPPEPTESNLAGFFALVVVEVPPRTRACWRDADERFGGDSDRALVPARDC